MKSSGKIIKRIAMEEGVTITELAERLGISRQALYKRLNGGMRYDNFVECIEALGYEIHYERFKDGEADSH